VRGGLLSLAVVDCESGRMIVVSGPRRVAGTQRLAAAATLATALGFQIVEKTVNNDMVPGEYFTYFTILTTILAIVVTAAGNSRRRFCGVPVARRDHARVDPARARSGLAFFAWTTCTAVDWTAHRRHFSARLARVYPAARCGHGMVPLPVSRAGDRLAQYRNLHPGNRGPHSWSRLIGNRPQPAFRSANRPRSGYGARITRGISRSVFS